MKDFPLTFTPKEWQTFAKTDLIRAEQYLREAIFEHFLKVRPAKQVTKEEKFIDKPINLATIQLNDEVLQPFEYPFSLIDFRQKREIRLDEFGNLVKKLDQELQARGWKTFVDKELNSLWIWPPDMKRPASVTDF